MTTLIAGDTGPYIDRLLREMSNELLFSERPGELCAWFERRGVRPSLAAVIAERARRRPAPAAPPRRSKAKR